MGSLVQFQRQADQLGLLHGTAFEKYRDSNFRLLPLAHLFQS